MPSITQIKYYIEVAKTLSFSQAAKQLYITQPTLSRQMSALEAELNMQLFFRTTRGLTLTPAGTVLLKAFETVYLQYKSGVEKAQQASLGYGGNINIGIVSGTYVNDIISETMDYFYERHPNIQINLFKFPFAELLQGLEDEELDLIISFDYHLCEQKNLIRKKLIPYQPVWFIPKCNPLSEKEQVYFKDFLNVDLLLLRADDWQDGHTHIVEYCKKYGGYYPQFYYVKDMDNLILYLETTDKCAFLNSRIKVSDRVKMYKVQELESEDRYLEYAWKQNNKKYSLDLLVDFFAQYQK